MDILTSDRVVQEFSCYLSCISPDTPTPHGLCVEVSGIKVFIHFSTICFWVNDDGKLVLINTPAATEKFVKRCFFEAYCDTMEQFFGVGVSEKPKNISGVKNNLLKIIALEKKLKEGRWEICTKNTG